MKPRTVRRLLWIVGFGCLWLPVFDDPPLTTGVCVQDVTAGGGTVAITTASAVVLGLEVVDARGGRLASLRDERPVRRHEFRVAGLPPGQDASFIVRDADGHEVDRGRLRTAPVDDRAAVRFAALGDSGQVPWWVWLQRSALFQLPARWGWLPPHGRVVGMAQSVLGSDPDFVLHLGDVVYPRGLAGHYGPAYFHPFAAVLRRAPCYGVLGNHDVMDDDGRQMLASFSLPTNGVTGDERCFSLVWGALRIIAIDACAPLDADHPSIRFLRRELAAAQEPWLAVASHFPIQSASRQGDRADLAEQVLPLLRHHAVDLYLSGHDHTYQRFGGDGDVVQVVSGGGGKSLYALGERPDLRAAASVYHHVRGDVAGGRLTLTAIALDGATIDAVVLRKDRAQLERIRQLNPARAVRIEALLD